jgi:hypothetical protein
VTREILWPRLLLAATPIVTLGLLLATIGAPTEMC